MSTTIAIVNSMSNSSHSPPVIYSRMAKEAIVRRRTTTHTAKTIGAHCLTVQMQFVIRTIRSHRAVPTVRHTKATAPNTTATWTNTHGTKIIGSADHTDTVSSTCSPADRRIGRRKCWWRHPNPVYPSVRPASPRSRPKFVQPNVPSMPPHANEMRTSAGN